MKVLAFIEQRDGKLKKNSFEVLTVGLKLAKNPSDLAAVVVGGKGTDFSKDLAGYGADKVFTVGTDNCARYNALTYAQAVEHVVNTFRPSVVLGAASAIGRDLFPRLAARFNGGILTDVISLDLVEGKLHGAKPMYAGKCIAELALTNCEIQFATIRPNVFAAEKSGTGAAANEALPFAPSDHESFKTVEVRKGSSEKADLTEATYIISGGRALGSADAFKIINECADVIGATVGASRAAVDAGYARHDMQVGQTGKTVNPNLYVACGISGSIQHMAGMRTSKVIVAINTDVEAPIFSIASYGIVGDLFKVVPVLKDKLKALVSH